MLYAKKDLYAEIEERRVQIAFAGRPVPPEFEGLADAGEVSKTPVEVPAEAPADEDPRRRPGGGAQELEESPKPKRTRGKKKAE